MFYPAERQGIFVILRLFYIEVVKQKQSDFCLAVFCYEKLKAAKNDAGKTFPKKVPAARQIK